RQASPLDVVAIEIVLFAEIQLAVGDDWRGPRGVTAPANLEPRLLLVTLRSGVDQAYDSILTQRIEPAFGIGDGAFTYAAVAPRHLAAQELHGCENAAGKSVQVVANQY